MYQINWKFPCIKIWPNNLFHKAEICPSSMSYLFVRNQRTPCSFWKALSYTTAKRQYFSTCMRWFGSNYPQILPARIEHTELPFDSIHPRKELRTFKLIHIKKKTGIDSLNQWNSDRLIGIIISQNELQHVFISLIVYQYINE